ncbi:PREDICTED: uncharacterized protein LOC109181278 [Ipomoea nil]|uniref:uncharacterized protein LOC109181278 n=1 Tax=Ipomoea nil TaxID=35883 RepID=UPI0009008F89|nr:PREDICTED: uncharacterized protein LOC109181278 [Ipomoea nil]
MSETLPSQRSTEESDLLERSTKKPKRSDEGRAHLGMVAVGDHALHADVEMVNETPLGEMADDRGGSLVHESEERASEAPASQRASTEMIATHRRSYADSVTGQNAEGGDTLEGGSEEDADEISDDEDDDPLCPTIRLTKAEVAAIRAPWRKALIIKVMGRKVGYAYLLRRLTSMWKLKGSLDLIAIDNDYFLVRFGSVEDLEFAMFEGPWMVLDHYLLVKPWVPDFDPYSDTTEKVLVWARIPCIPAEYYNYIFLRKLGNKVGRTIRVDQATSLVSRGMFARICVEVDITKPLISKFKYNDKVRSVAYEGIHMICFSCGIYGHATDNCPSKVIEKTTEENLPEGNAQGQATAVEKAGHGNQGTIIGSEPFGIWMIAPGRKQRARPKHQVSNMGAAGERRVGGNARRPNGIQASRFAPLNNQEEDGGGQEEGEPNREPEQGGAAEHTEQNNESAQGAGSMGNNTRRPNVRASERQILNEPCVGNGTGSKGGEQAIRARRGGGSSLRRAAEEDKYVVIRGAQGGLVISSTRVVHGDRADDLPSPVWQATNEHHNDPPGHLDEEGDVVMALDRSVSQHEGEGGTDAHLLWNCQGASGKSFHRALSNLLKVHKPNILGLFEPKVSGTQANKICNKLGFSDWVRVEAIGFSGGGETGTGSLVFLPVYGSPTHHLRRLRWNDLRQSKRAISGPWLVAGDFNSVVQREETRNYSSFSMQRSSDFVNWIQEEGLIDLGFSGPSLTWVKDGSENDFKGARLDRALCNTEWRTSFPDASVSHLPRIASDHAPVLIHTEKNRRRSSPPCFMYQAAWPTPPDFLNVVRRDWMTTREIPNNVSNVAGKLADWNKAHFGNIFIRKKILLARLGGIQSRLAISFHRGLAKLERKLRADLEEILHQEELFWYQKSREEWIASGDRNTAYYHAATTIRKSRNNVTRLQDKNGN